MMTRQEKKAFETITECRDEFAADPFEAVMDYINDYLIYTADQWEIIQDYQSPEDANLSDALDTFAENVAAELEEWDNEQEEEEEDEEEDE